MSILKRHNGINWEYVTGGIDQTASLPSGGDENDYLGKLSDTDGDAGWISFLHDHYKEVLKPEYIEFLIPSSIPTNVRSVYWDDTNKTIAVKVEDDIVVNLSANITILCKNVDSVSHQKGQPVFITTGEDMRAGVELANSTTSGILALAAHDVSNSGDGLGQYCFLGNIEDLTVVDIKASTDDANTWIAGAEVWVSTEVGKLTTTKPPKPNVATKVGWVTDRTGTKVALHIHTSTEDSQLTIETDDPQNGDILIHNDGLWINKSKEDAGLKVYHGFTSRTTSTMDFNPLTREFSLIPNPEYAVYVNGTKITVDTTLTVTIPDRVGQHFLSFIEDKLVTVSDTPWNILDPTSTLLATLHWDGTKGIIGEERHDYRRNLIEHRNQHDTWGTVYVQGFDPDPTFSTNNTFSFAGGVTRDEDLYHVFTGLQTECGITYRNAAKTTLVFENKGTNWIKLNSGIPQYDNDGILTDVTDKWFTTVWMFATNYQAPAARIISVVGQEQYEQKTGAVSSPIPTLSGTSVAEFRPLYKIVIESDTGAFNVRDIIPMYMLNTGPVVHGGGANTVHASQVQYTPDTILSTNVQSAIEELDNKKQDKLISGVNIKTVDGQSLIGGGNISISDSGHVIQHESVNQPQQPNLNFKEGFIVEDNPTNNSTDVTIDPEYNIEINQKYYVTADCLVKANIKKGQPVIIVSGEEGNPVVGSPSSATKSDIVALANEDIDADEVGSFKFGGKIEEVNVSDVQATGEDDGEWIEGAALYLKDNKLTVDGNITDNIRVGWIAGRDGSNIDIWVHYNNYEVCEGGPDDVGELPVGAIIRGSSNGFPGTIRCNGALLAKDEYPALYNAIGDDFAYLGFNTYINGKPHKQQYEFNDEDNDPGYMSWSNVASSHYLATAAYASQAIVTKNRVYLLGGHAGSATNVVQTAIINPDGTLGTWSNVASSHYLATAAYASRAIVTKNRVYLLGGHAGSATNVVQTADINPDGTLGTWSNVASSHYLATAIYNSQAIVTKNRVYLLGGHSSSITNVVQTANFEGGSSDYTGMSFETFEDDDHFFIPDTTYEDNKYIDQSIRSYIKY